MEVVFWSSLAVIFYAYAGFPLVMAVYARLRPDPPAFRDPAPSALSVVLPIHNEGNKIRAKLENLLANSPGEIEMEVVVVTDACSDDSVSIVRDVAAVDPRVRLVERTVRSGKGGALNAGVDAAAHGFIVFTDAALLLDPGSLSSLLGPFRDPRIGCVSGEDRIVGEGGGESAYGSYELWLRRKESSVSSIVGASGCLYAQRREVVPTFRPGIAPDFLSVLHTVGKGFRAVSEPLASGTMRATPSASEEFARKVRTLVRGMAGLVAYRTLMNPFRHGRFAFILASHKLVRWAVPAFLLAAFLSNALLLGDGSLYRALFGGQLALYALGGLALPAASPLRGMRLARICGFFILANVAVAWAWLRFLRGERQEIWQPTLRETA